MAPIIRTCKPLLLAATVLAASPAAASVTPPSLAAYVRARAADGDNRPQQAAVDYAAALAADPDNVVIAVRAYRAALDVGDVELERRARGVLDRARVAPDDAALLALADALVAGDKPGTDRAIAAIGEGPLAFLVPMLRAWTVYPADARRALTLVDTVPQRSIGAHYAQETRALLLIASGKTAEGVAILDGQSGGIDDGAALRRSAAQLLAGKGDAKAAAALLPAGAPAVRPVVASPRFGIARLYLALAHDLVGDETGPLAVALARAAFRLDPDQSRARIVLAEALSQQEALKPAIAELEAITPDDPAYAEAQAARIGLLRQAGDVAQAQATAARIASAPGAGAASAQLYGEVLLAAERPAEAAKAFSLAIDRTDGAAGWLLYLQAGSAYDQAGDWKSALPLIRKAVALAPDQPAALNYLGYGQLEHGGNVAEATRLLERASSLKPGDAAILDSLAWAYFRGGDAERALPLLERATEAEPADATIAEHLGDAYWQLGRRYEARYAWRAAGRTAAASDAPRIAAKIADGPSVD